MLKKPLSNLAYASIAYDKRAIYKTKNNKRAALERVITKVFDIALILQKNEAGWLDSHALSAHEKYWLDPMGETFKGMSVDQIERQQAQLKDKVILMLAGYINNSLEALGGEHADIFDSYSFNDIRKEIESMAKKFKRNNLGVFHDY